MRLPCFQYHAPKSLNALISLKERYGDEGHVMAGGTELLPRMKLRLVKPGHIISLLNIKELEKISVRKNEVELGAALKIDDLATFFNNNRPFHGLSRAANLIASQQIRNMATIGGNILQNTRCMFYNRSWQWQKTVPPCYKRGGNLCHAVKNSKRCLAVYQGDLAPVLITLDAKAVIFSDNQRKTLPLEEIFTGNGAAPFHIKDGILTKIVMPINENHISVYKKYRIRDGLDFPLAGVALSLKYKDKKVEDLKLCLTGIFTAPIIIKDIKEISFDRKLDKNLAKEIAEMAYKHTHPVDNIEGSRELRKLMVKEMTFEAIQEIIKNNE